MYYRLGQSFSRPWAAYEYPRKKKLILPPKPFSGTIYFGDVTHNVTLTDSNSNYKIRTVALTQSVSTSQVINAFKIRTASLTHSISVSDVIFKVGHEYFVSVSHDVTIAQTLRQNRVLPLTVTQSISLAEQYGTSSTQVRDFITVSDSISLLRVLRRSVSHNINVESVVFLNSPRVMTVTQNVTVSDVFAPRLGTVRVAVADNISVVQAFGFHRATIHVSVTQNITVEQFIRVIGYVNHQTVIQTVSLSHKVNTGYRKKVEHDINVFQSISKSRLVTRTLTTTPSITSIFGRDLTFSLETNLGLISEFGRTLEVTRDFATPTNLISVFNGVLFVTVSGQSPDGIYRPPSPHPIASGIDFSYSDLIILEGFETILILPVPEFNDSQRQNDSIDLKRTMNPSVVRAFVKKSNTTQLTYTWMLDSGKAREFRAWMIKNMNKEIRITNWKGEVWLGKIINDDFILKAETAYQGTARQKTSATLQFEGVKING